MFLKYNCIFNINHVEHTGFGLAVGVVSNAESLLFYFFDGVSFGNVIDLLLCSVLIIG